ncbi:MAG TPA: response regulator transcription factor [Cyclobacteriaceae bacterium]|jgi:DNA-binding response OmpR family regulator|nr:response regulator transcription factor [Cyclobacteriaceae bacterium]
MKVLLIEDEQELADSIVQYLKGNDVICEWANTIAAADDKISSHFYDCILLDLSLPDGHGFEILKALKNRNSTEGIIIISAKETLHSKIEGLNLGADDYLTKPFHISELLARVQALVRRKNFHGNNVVRFQEIEIDTLAKSVKIGTNAIDLTRKEMDLLLFMIGNQNRVLSKSTIAEHLSGDMADMLDNHDFVYAHIKNLKKKLHEAGCKDYVKTVYGLGYKWQ